MKQVTIIGNIGANAVRRMTSDGKELMTFNVAVNVQNGDPIWFNCVGTLREKLLPYLVKGQCVCVVGELKPALYNGQLDLTVSIDRCELCGAKPEDHSQDTPSATPSAPVGSFDAANQQTL